MAFFFLFFFHGNSIGTRQQGISYNSLIAETLYRIYSQFGMIGELFKTFFKKDQNILGSMRNLIYFYARLAIQLVTKTN